MMMTEIFEGEYLARIIDRFVCVGEFAIISVLILIAEQLETLKLDSLHYERAKVMIIQKAKAIDLMKLCYTLMNCNSDKKIFSAYIREKRLQAGLLIDVDSFIEQRNQKLRN